MCMPLALVNRQRGDEVTAAAQNIPIGHSKKTGREAVRTGHNEHPGAEQRLSPSVPTLGDTGSRAWRVVIHSERRAGVSSAYGVAAAGPAS
jgi:hypothetical protein